MRGGPVTVTVTPGSRAHRVADYAEYGACHYPARAATRAAAETDRRRGPSSETAEQEHWSWFPTSDA